MSAYPLGLHPFQFRPTTPTAPPRRPACRAGAHQGGLAERKAMIDRESNTIFRSRSRRRFCVSAVAASTTCRGRFRKPTLRSCGVSTDCTWSSLSPARGCCEACWRPQGCKIGRRHVKTLMRRMEARASIGRYLDFYNGRRPHSSLVSCEIELRERHRCDLCQTTIRHVQRVAEGARGPHACPQYTTINRQEAPRRQCRREYRSVFHILKRLRPQCSRRRDRG